MGEMHKNPPGILLDLSQFWTFLSALALPDLLNNNQPAVASDLLLNGHFFIQRQKHREKEMSCFLAREASITFASLKLRPQI